MAEIGGSQEARQLSWHARQNRDAWDRESDAAQAKHGEFLKLDDTIRWGIWQIPDHVLGALGEVSGLRVLEMGCGAGQLAVKLAKQGAEVVGIDVSERQLAHARAAVKAAGADVTLVCASADDTPLPSEGFDLICSDHGGLTYADPRDVIPEAARLLRPGGRLVFNTSTPWVAACWSADTESVVDYLQAPYFGMVGFMGHDGLRSYERGDLVEFQLPYGEWVRSLVGSGFVIEDLVELHPPDDGETTYTSYVPREWALSWPAENLWKARRGEDQAQADV